MPTLLLSRYLLVLLVTFDPYIINRQTVYPPHLTRANELSCSCSCGVVGRMAAEGLVNW